MTSPCAILCYEKILPGSQVAVRLEDLGYQVEVLNDLGRLASAARRAKPIVVLVDMEAGKAASAIETLRKTEGTSHIPVLAFADEEDEESARLAGADLVTGKEALLAQLPSLLSRVLELKE